MKKEIVGATEVILRKRGQRGELNTNPLGFFQSERKASRGDSEIKRERRN